MKQLSFTIAESKEYTGVKYDFLEEIDKGHGRVETRRYWITSHLETIPKTENWEGLTSIGMVEMLDKWKRNSRKTLLYMFNTC